MDNLSLYYKTPLMSEFLAYDENGYVVRRNDMNGKYYFYSQNAKGEKSDLVWIEKNTSDLIIKIIKDDKSNTAYITWEDTTLNVKVNKEPYSKEQLIYKEGNYYIEVTDRFNNKYEYVLIIDHLFIFKEKILPSCDRGGYSIYECVTCNLILQKDKTNSLSHDIQTEQIMPTCTNDGYLLTTCKNCSYQEREKNMSKIGHDYIEVVREANCDSDGGKIRVCVNCSEEEFLTIIKKTGHNYQAKITHPATCDKEGIREFVCQICDNVYNEKIPKLNHEYEKIKEEERDELIVVTYQCKMCDKIYNEDIIKKTELIDSGLNSIINIYERYLVLILSSTIGVWSLYCGIGYVMANKKDEKELAKRKIINYIIGLIVIFVIMVVCPLLIKGISSLF